MLAIHTGLKILKVEYIKASVDNLYPLRYFFHDVTEKLQKRKKNNFQKITFSW